MRSASTGIFPKGSNCLKSSEPVVREAASSEEPVSIREVQHFAYCPHRWGLIHIGCDWSENAFVNRAKLIHERVDGGKPTALRGSIVERSVQVYDDEWGLFGVLDALELKPSDHGVFIPKYRERFALTVIEYKPSVPRSEHALFADRMQLLAQKICADRVFGAECSACFYYADTRKRAWIRFEEEDRVSLAKILRSIGDCRREGRIPSPQKSALCSGCSMKDICLPKAGGERCENC